MSPERYTGIRVTLADAERFRQFAREIAADVGRDVTHTEVLAAMTADATERRAQIAARLAAPPADTSGGAALSDRTAYANAGK